MDLFDQVIDLALSLPDGQTDNSCACPKCGHSDFSITRSDGKLKFICFRVSCGFHGRTDSKGEAMRGEDKPVVQKKLFTGKLDRLNLFEMESLIRKFKIDHKLLKQVRWGVDDGRVYFPQYHVDGRIQGYIARFYPELTDHDCKGAKAYWKPVLSRDAGLCLPTMSVLKMIHEQKRVVLVEDYPSCLRIISQLNIPCCCMGGTNLYDSMVSTLIKLGVEQVIILLDADAVVKAMKMQRSISLVFPDTVVVPLTGPDPKDMTEYELYLNLKHIINKE